MTGNNQNFVELVKKHLQKNGKLKLQPNREKKLSSTPQVKGQVQPGNNKHITTDIQ